MKNWSWECSGLQLLNFCTMGKPRVEAERELIQEGEMLIIKQTS